MSLSAASAPALALVALCGCHDARAHEPPAAGSAREVPAAPPTTDASAPPPSATADADACPAAPHELAPGLVAERHAIAAAPLVGDGCIDVVRADLSRYQPRMLAASRDGGLRTAPAWRDAFGLAAVINAGMFHDDGSPVGLVAIDDALLGHDNPKMGGYLALGPRDPAQPAAVATGRTCDGFDLAALRARYHIVLQSYRLLGCSGEQLPWADPKHYSAVAMGVDRRGQLVLLHARAAWTMAELSAALADLDLTGALFLEGGPEASLVAGPLARTGSYETGFNENDANTEFWRLPLVLGVMPRAR